jgi:hypothetical protein
MSTLRFAQARQALGPHHPLLAIRDSAQEVVRAIAQHGVKAYGPRGRVPTKLPVENMFSMVQRLGAIGVLVNNAELQRDASLRR